jgi:hypothetical protein
MNLPADMLRALGLSGPGRVILIQDEEGVRITTASQALKRIRELALPYKPTDRLASEQLIEERRREAARERAEADTVSP